MSAKPENDRERIARIIDPEAWGTYDHVASLPNGVMDAVMKYVEPSLAQADEVLAIIAQRESGADEPVAVTDEMIARGVKALFPNMLISPEKRVGLILSEALAGVTYAPRPAEAQARVVGDTCPTCGALPCDQVNTPKPARVYLTEEKIAEIVREHFYPGPVTGSTARLAAALTAALTPSPSNAGEAG